MTTKLEWLPQTMPDGHIIDSSVTASEVARLRQMAGGRLVLEIGSGFGFSTVHLAQVAEHVWAIDPHAGELPGSFETMLANLHRYGLLDRVTVVREYSETALPPMLALERKFGLAFVDGNHGYNVAADVGSCIELLEPDGWLAVHDYDQFDFPVIKDVLDALKARPDVVDTLWCARRDDLP